MMKKLSILLLSLFLISCLPAIPDIPGDGLFPGEPKPESQTYPNKLEITGCYDTCLNKRHGQVEICVSCFWSTNDTDVEEVRAVTSTGEVISWFNPRVGEKYQMEFTSNSGSTWWANFFTRNSGAIRSGGRAARDVFMIYYDENEMGAVFEKGDRKFEYRDATYIAGNVSSGPAVYHTEGFLTKYGKTDHGFSTWEIRFNRYGMDRIKYMWRDGDYIHVVGITREPGKKGPGISYFVYRERQDEPKLVFKKILRGADCHFIHGMVFLRTSGRYNVIALAMSRYGEKGREVFYGELYLEIHKGLDE